MKLWKRNAVVAAIVVFVCAAVYLNWTYEQETDAGKVLGQAELVGAESSDPLLTGGAADPSASPAVSAAVSPAPSPTAAQTSDYFASARLNRQEARDSALSLLQDAAANEEADVATLTELNEAIETMASSTVSEAQIENLVIAKGYADCVAFLNEGSASIVVAPVEGGLTEADVARIAEIVTDETGLTSSQIKIIECE